MTPARLWIRRSLFAAISGIVLTILIPLPAAMVSDTAAGFPGSAFRYSFGVVERNGTHWSVECMKNAYFTEIDAKPFATREQAEAWQARSQKLVESILRLNAARGARVESEFSLPAWELATKLDLKPYDGPTPGKGADLPTASCRGIGVPMHYGCWLETRVPNPPLPASNTRRGTLKWLPLPHATLIYWPGLLINVLIWSAASLCAWSLCRVAARSLKKPRPQPSAQT